MTLNQLASKLSKLEGKKQQASIGDIREILKILVKWETDVIIKHLSIAPMEPMPLEELPIATLLFQVKDKVEKWQNKKLEKATAIVLSLGKPQSETPPKKKKVSKKSR